MRLAAPLLLAIVALNGCARTLPRGKASASLYRDLQRLVGLASTTGWGIDRIEVDALQSDALQSVCRTPLSSRLALLDWLDERIDRLGGPVDKAYRRRGKKLSRVKQLLELTRIRKVLATSIERADDDCPFWIEPDPKFRGRQIADDRWQLSFGGGGKLTLVEQEGNKDVNFGGAGRLVFGRAIGSRVSILTGLEAGASASFPRDEMGNRGALVLGVDVVAPLVARYRFVNSYLEVEAGPMGRFIENGSGDIIKGAHAGIAFGGRASRKRWFFPGAVFGASFEQTFPTAGQEPARTVIKLGFRVAIDVDL